MKSIGTKKPCSPPRSQGFNTTNHHKGSISMTSLALSFNDVNFRPIQQDGQIWLSASELAKALGYAKSDAVGQVYERNRDEFNSSMTTTITVKSDEFVETLNLSVSKKTKNLTKTIRIFSLRGCHLVAMFAKTLVAKKFRKWVLDILDKEVGSPVAKTHKSERTALHEAHALLVTKTKHLNVNEAWKLIHQRFNVDHIEDIPYEAIPVAVEYVHHLIALYSSANKHAGLFDKDAYELVRHLCERVILENEEVVVVLEKFRGILDSRKFLFYANYIVRSNEAVRNLSRLLDFKNKHDQPLIDVNCKTIALSTGQRFITNPNWFNAPA